MGHTISAVGRRRRHSGFTLLEVLIALAILTVSLLILVSTQSSAARMNEQADRILIGTMLAKQKMSEVEIQLDNDIGFSEQDVVEDEGDFEGTFPGRYPEYRWHASVRKLDLRSANTAGLSDLVGMGSGGPGAESSSSSASPGSPEQPDLTSLIPMDQISEQLARFIREVKVTVFWQNGNEPDEVTLTTHVIKPTGPSFQDPTANGDATANGGANGTANSAAGGGAGGGAGGTSGGAAGGGIFGTK